MKKEQITVTMEMPTEAAERLQRLWDQKDPAFLAYLAEQGFALEDIQIRKNDDDDDVIDVIPAARGNNYCENA